MKHQAYIFKSITDKPTGLFMLNDKLHYSVTEKIRSNNEGFHLYVTLKKEPEIGELCYYSVMDEILAFDNSRMFWL